MRVPDECIQAGLAHLASQQDPSGGFSVVVTVGGPGFPSGAVTSPFVTALVLDALRTLGERFGTRPLIDRGLAYLLHEMEAGGFWRFYRCDPPIRHDLDSTSLSLLALSRHGVPLDYLAAARRIASNRDAAGLFKTWVVDTPPLLRRLVGNPRTWLRRPFNVVDPVVNANVVSFLHTVGLEAPEAESYLVARAKGDDALEGSPYYLHAECFVHALSKVAEASPPGDALTAACRSLVERQIPGGAVPRPTQPFLLMRLLAASVLLRPDWLDPGSVAQTVMATQLADGSWPWGPVWTAVRWSAGAPRPLLGSPVVETAIALEALNRASGLDSHRQRPTDAQVPHGEQARAVQVGR